MAQTPSPSVESEKKEINPDDTLTRIITLPIHEIYGCACPACVLYSCPPKEIAKEGHFTVELADGKKFLISMQSYLHVGANPPPQTRYENAIHKINGKRI